MAQLRQVEPPMQRFQVSFYNHPHPHPHTQVSYGTKKYSGDATVDGTGKATLAATLKEVAPGLNLSGTVVLPDVSSAKVTVDYVNPYLSLKSSIALTSAPIFDIAAATSYKSFLFGAEAAFDTGKSKVTKSNVALGYSASDYSLALVLSDVGTGADPFSSAKVSYAHTVTPTTSAGAEVTRKVASGDTTFALAYSKKLESGASTKFKIDNTGAFTSYYETKLVSGEKVASSLQIQATDLAKPLKFGFAVDLA